MDVHQSVDQKKVDEKNLVSDMNKVTMNLSLPKHVKVGLKVYAAKRGVSVSRVIEEWYYDHCD